MAISWDEVTNKPEFLALSPADQEATRNSYYDDVVSPNVAPEHQDYYRAQFDKDTSPKQNQTSAVGEIGRAIGRGVLEVPKMLAQATQTAIRPSDTADTQAAQALKTGGYTGHGIYDYLGEVAKKAEEFQRSKPLRAHPEQHGAVVNTLAEGAQAIPASIAPLALSAIPVVGPALAVGAAGATFGAAQAQQDYEQARAAGKSHEEAVKLSSFTGGIEATGETAGEYALLKLFNSFGGGKSKVAKEAFSRFTDPKWLGQFGASWAKNAAIQSATEFGQGAGEAAVKQSYGVGDNHPLEEGLHGGVVAGAMSLLLGPLAGYGHFKDSRQRALTADILQNPPTDSDPEKTALITAARSQAAKNVAEELRNADPVAADAWHKSAIDAIGKGKSVNLDEGFAANWNQQAVVQTEAEKMGIDASAGTISATSSGAAPITYPNATANDTIQNAVNASPGAQEAVQQKAAAEQSAQEPQQTPSQVAQAAQKEEAARVKSFMPLNTMEAANKLAAKLTARTGVEHVATTHPAKEGKFAAVPNDYLQETTKGEQNAIAVRKNEEQVRKGSAEGQPDIRRGAGEGGGNLQSAAPEVTGIEQAGARNRPQAKITKEKPLVQKAAEKEAPQAEPKQPEQPPKPTPAVAAGEPAPSAGGQNAKAVTVDEAAHVAATSPLNETPQPTPDQKAAGNYKIGRATVGGLSVSIENPQGSVRKSHPDAPKQWKTTMQDHYGYFVGVAARAPDKDHVDTFIKPGTPENFDGNAYIVDQKHIKTGKFDEPKVMVGYASQEEASKAYHANYEKGWQGMMGITPVSMVDLKDKLQDKSAFMQPQVTSIIPPKSAPVAPAEPAPPSTATRPNAIIRASRIGLLGGKNIVAGRNAMGHDEYDALLAKSADAAATGEGSAAYYRKAIKQFSDIPEHQPIRNALTKIADALESVPKAAKTAIYTKERYDKAEQRAQKVLTDDELRVIDRMPEGASFKALTDAYEAAITKHLSEVKDEGIKTADERVAAGKAKEDHPQGGAEVGSEGVAAAQGEVIRVGESAHKDEGKPTEAATPNVVAKSLAKGDANSKLTLAQIREKLLGDVGAAIAAVRPTKQNEFYAEAQKLWKSGKKTHIKVSNEDVQKVRDIIGYTTFDVPGDGVFKVLNTVENLTRFREEVSRSQGFKKSVGQPRQETRPPLERPVSQGNPETYVKQALNDDHSTAEDLQNAIEVARDNNIDDVELVKRHGELVVMEAEAEKFNLDIYGMTHRQIEKAIANPLSAKKTFTSGYSENKPTAEPKPPQEQQEVKEPWQMSQEEWNAATRFYNSGGTKNAELPTGERVILKQESTAKTHTQVSADFYKKLRGITVSVAVKEGKPVPAEVLADYPDLKPSQPAQAEQPASGEGAANLDESDPRNWSVSKMDVDQMLERLWGINREMYREDGLNSWRDLLPKYGADDVGLVADSEYTLYDRYLKKLPEGVGAQDVLRAYEKNELRDKVETKTSTPPIQTKKTGSQEKNLPYSQKRSALNESTAKKLWETANQRSTKNNEAEVSDARYKLFIEHNANGVVDKLGIPTAEFNKKLRSWVAFPAKAASLHQSLNFGKETAQQWWGIPNVSYISKHHVSSEDVGAMVKDINAPDKAWNTPDGESLRRYIMRTFLGVDTGIEYSDLSFRVDNALSSLGLYQHSKQLITIKANSPNTVAHEIGHYLDNKWAREVGKNDGFASDLGYTKGIVTDRTSPEREQWMGRFKEFVDDLGNRAQISSEYHQRNTEVFARFVDKFVTWTETKAGVRGWGEPHYSDKFNESDFRRFVKLLQEKSYVDIADGNKLDPTKRALEINPNEIDNGVAMLGKSPVQQQAIATANKLLNRDKMSDITTRLLYNFQDNFIDLRRVVKRAVGVTEEQDASLAQELYSGTVKARTDDFHQDQRDPLIKAMHDAKVKYEELHEYLHAKHAPTRNRLMREINPTAEELDVKRTALTETRDSLADDADVLEYKSVRKQLRVAEADVQDGEADQSAVDALNNELAKLRKKQNVKDYVGAVDELRALQNAKPFTGDNTALSGMGNKEAADILAKAKQDGRDVTMEALSKKVYAIIAKTRENMVKGGLITPEEKAAWEAKYGDTYVPLHRDEVGANGLPPIGQGMNIRGKEAKAATGSTKEVTNILAHVVAQQEASIIRTEKNAVDTAMFNFLKAHPDSEVATLDEADMVSAVDKTTGLVVRRVDPTYKNKPNVLTFKINGEEHTITFNEQNPEAMRMAAAFKNLSSQELGEITKMVGGVTRFLATMNTSANPVFLARNFMRDLQTAFVNLSDTELASKKYEVFKNVIPAIRGFWAMSRTGDQSEWGKWAREFRDAGGQTGWLAHYENIGARADEFKKMLAAMGEGKGRFTLRQAKWLWSALQDANAAVENGVRLASYVAARKSGMSEAKSAQLAKNLTVNFNKHGAKGVELNAWYMFMNASIQGTARLGKAAMNKNVQKMLAATVVSGLTMDILARSLAGDDDDDGENDYDQLPEYVKANNWIFWVNGAPVTIPMPYGYNFIASVGRKFSEQIFRPNYSAAQGAMDLGSAALGAFSPLGSTGSALQFAMPTVADPFVQLAENKNFAGNPIFKEQAPYSVPKPQYQMGFKSASAPAQWLAEWMNEFAGGNEVRPAPGMFNMNPSVLDFIVSTGLGGFGKTALQTSSLPIKLAGEEPIQGREIPFWNIFTSAKPEYQIEAKYYKNIKAVQLTAEEVKNYRGNPEELASIRAEHAGEIRLGGRAKMTSLILEKLNQRKRMIEKNDPSNREALDANDARRKAVMAQFNKAYVEATAR